LRLSQYLLLTVLSASSTGRFPEARLGVIAAGVKRGLARCLEVVGNVERRREEDPLIP
jgi:hypothetical protein